MRKTLAIVAFLMTILPSEASFAAAQNSPKAVISYLRDAYDADSWDGAISVWWPDEVVITDRDGKPPKERISFKDQPMSGIGVQYRTKLTFLNERITGNRAVVVTSEKSETHYDTADDGGYEHIGIYSINQVRYVSEKRGGQWRILSREILSGRSFGSDNEWRRRQEAKWKKLR